MLNCKLFKNIIFYDGKKISTEILSAIDRGKYEQTTK